MEKLSFDKIESFLRLRKIPYGEGREFLKQELTKQKFSPDFVAHKLLIAIAKEYSSVLIDQGSFFSESYLQEIIRRLSVGIEHAVYMCRLGPDILAIGINSSGNFNSAQLLNQFSFPIFVNGKLYPAYISVGAFDAQSQDFDVETLIGFAHVSAITATKKSNSEYVILESDHLADHIKALSKQNQLVSRVKKAIIDEEFEVFYQPIVSLPERKIIGFECLARLLINDQMISPAEFLPVLRSNNLTGELDIQILKKTIASIPNILSNSPSTFYTFSLNVSSQLVMNEDLLSNYISILNGFDSSLQCSLQLEIIEDAFEEDSNGLNMLCRACEINNIKLAIDDFGMGSSTLKRLFRLPISVLKLDKFFVDDVVCKDSQKHLEAYSILFKFFSECSLTLLAEGVETEEQVRFLCSNNIQKAQGFLFSKPLSLSHLLDFLSFQKSQPVFTISPSRDTKSYKHFKLFYRWVRKLISNLL